jgi:very-short-patch-repair endonuclease
VVPVEHALLHLASVQSFQKLLKALPDAEYRGLLEPRAIEAALGRGRAGSRMQRRALEHHLRQLAVTRSELEERFLLLCRRSAIPIPEVNVMVGTLLVDALWREQRVVVELDGHAAHASPAAIERDRRRDLELRAAGYAVLRYTWRQVTREPERVADDLRLPLRAGFVPEGCRSG